MEPGWWAKLEGEDDYLDDLVRYYSTPALRVIREPDGVYLGSTKFAALEDERRAMREEADRLAALAAGGAAVQDGGTRPPRVTVIYQVDKDGIRHPHLPTVTSSFRVSRTILGEMTVTREDGTVEVVPAVPAPRADDYAWLAESDRAVEEVLRVLGRQEPSWHDLYFVYDVVRNARNITQGKEPSNWPTVDLNNFTGTANSHKLLGLDARHGFQLGKPPKRAMSLVDARKLITIVVRNWLNARLDAAGRPVRMVEYRPRSKSTG
jgi:hypothetical protein